MMSPTELDLLVIRAQGGDRTAFHAVVEAIDEELRRFVAARAPSADLIEEAVQAAFVTAYLKLAEYQPRGSFASWLKGIARNHLLQELDKQRRTRPMESDVLDQLVDVDAQARLDGAESEAAAEADLTSLARCLEKLPARTRMMFHRRYADGLPLDRLAQQFKQGAEALAALFYRTRRSLQVCIEQQRGPR